ncbi:MAG: hypothetical protein ACWA45_09385, partial [Flavobacteriales bacterium]
MQLKFKKYTLLFITLTCLFASYLGFAQDNKKDTLFLINQQIKQSKEAINNQDFNKANKKLNRANHLIFASKKDSLKPLLYVNTASLDLNLHNYNKAKQEISRAIELLKKTKNNTLLARAYTLYGYVLIQTSNFKDAEKNLKEADLIYTALNDEKNQTIVSFYFGILEFKKKNYKIAINYFEASCNYLKSYKIYDLQAQCYLYKAETYFYLNKNNEKPIEKSKKALKEAIKIIDKQSLLPLKIE